MHALFGIGGIPVATWLAKTLGKKRALTYTLGVGLVAFGSAWWLYTPTNPWLSVLCTGLNGFSATGLIRELEHRRDARGDAKSSATAPPDLERRWTSRDQTGVKSMMENPFSALLHEYFTGVHSAPGQLLPHVVRSATKMLFLICGVPRCHIATAVELRSK